MIYRVSLPLFWIRDCLLLLVYIAVLVLIFNSATYNSTILALLPNYCKVHLQYMRDRFPSFFPNFESDIDTLPNDFHDLTDIPALLSHTVAKIAAIRQFIQEGSLDGATNMLSQCSRDLNVVSELGSGLRANASYYILYMKLLRSLLQVRSRNICYVLLWYQVKLQHLRVVTPKFASKILQITYKMQYLYSGTTAEAQYQLLLWRVYAHLLYLVHYLGTNKHDNLAMTREAKLQAGYFVERCEIIQKYALSFTPHQNHYANIPVKIGL